MCTTWLTHDIIDTYGCIVYNNGDYGMHLQKAKIGQSGIFWLVLGDDYLPIEPIKKFLLHFKNINNSSVHSIRTYAYRLKIYWEYLSSINQEWQLINYSEFTNFIKWLRFSSNTVIPIQDSISKRTESTINSILSAVSSFYQFHKKLGEVDIRLIVENKFYSSPYKSLLHHIKKTKPVSKSIIRVKQRKLIPKTITQEQADEIKNHCTSLRDKFLVSLLHETGMRIGQALGLHHEDIKSWNNEIIIRYRDDNENMAYSKSKNEYIVHVSNSILSLYADYVIKECHNLQSDFVFVNLQSRYRGRPLGYSSVQYLFNRLSQKSGIHITPHMYRHSHATELIQAGWDGSYVQKRLGHASVQTTMDLYTHLSDSDLKNAFKDYQKQKELL